MTIDNVWVEHTVCAYWGVSVSGLTITNSRFRNTFADAVNMTNGSTNNLITNNEGRGNGDDAFALFSANDAGGGANTGNVFENLTATVTWRAAGIAVYGGHSNTFRNLYIADMLTYSGLTISSLDFGYPFVGFGPQLTTFDNISLVRAGGHFWGNQTFGAIWAFSASKEFRGHPGVQRGHRRSDVLRDHVPDEVRRARCAGDPGAGHGLHEHLDLGRAEER